MGDPRAVRLLAVITGLLAVLVIGLGVTTAIAVRGVAQLRGELASRGGAVRELSARQADASRQLGATARDARRQIAQLEERASELRQRGNGLLPTLARMAEMQQLMTDQMNLLLKEETTMQEVLSKSLRPVADGEPTGGEQRPRAARRPPAATGESEAREPTPPEDARR